MAQKEKIKLGVKSKSTLKDKFNMEFPFLWEATVNTKWYLKHKIPIFNTILTKQIKNLASEIDNLKKNSREKENKKILFFAMRQDPPHLGWGSALELSLILRGHNVQKIACDGFIRRACNTGHYPDLKRKSCYSCRLYSKRFHEVSPVNTDWLSSFAQNTDWKNAENLLKKTDPVDFEKFSYKGFPIGEYAKSSTVHFLREGEIKLEKSHRDVFKDFIIGGVAMVDVCERILDKYKPDILVMLNGWFISERVMLEVAKKRGIRVVTYENGFRANTLFFSEGKPVEYEINELWEKYKNTPLSNTQITRINNYLNEREKGDLGWANFEMTNNKIEEVRNSLQLNPSQKTAVAFSSISWDSTLWGLDVGFRNLEDWLYKTIQYYINKQDWQLIVRLHPGEIVDSVASRDSMQNKINQIFPELPENIKIIPPTSSVSSYTLMELSDVGLVYTSTTGLEMAIKGIPVIVAGIPHYRGKGFTFDPSTEEDYYKMNNLIMNGDELKEIIEKRKEISKRYAYRLFFDGCIPFKPTMETASKKLNQKITFSFHSVIDLLPGKDKGLDIACERILTGIYQSL